MKTIGILGGMSWESSLEYYRIMNEEVKARLGGLHSASLVMHSFDFEPLSKLLFESDWPALAEILSGQARKLEEAGADCLVIATNTMHQAAPLIEEAVGIPLIHIADAAGRAIQQAGLERVELLGTRFTMELDFYRLRLKEKFGVEVLIPESDDRELINRVIFDELCLGLVEDGSRREYLRIIDELAGRGAQGVVLGCTEIPLLVGPKDTALPLLDTTALHAKAAVDFALS